MTDSVTARLATFVQAGGANLLMRAESGRLLLKEVKGGEMVQAIGVRNFLDFYRLKFC